MAIISADALGLPGASAETASATRPTSCSQPGWADMSATTPAVSLSRPVEAGMSTTRPRSPSRPDRGGISATSGHISRLAVSG